MAIAENRTSMQNGLRTVAEAAAYLSLSRSTIYSLMDAGKLAFVKIGKARRVRWADVERLVQENLHGGE